MDPRERFITVWRAFLTTLRGRLLREGKALDHVKANQILQERMLAWQDPSEKEGAFFLSLEPDLQEQLRTILCRDMCFQKPKSPSMGGIAYLSCAVTAGLGAAIPAYFDKSHWMCILCGAISGGSVLLLQRGFKSSGEPQLVELYLSQLEKYYASALSLLENA